MRTIVMLDEQGGKNIEDTTIIFRETQPKKSEIETHFFIKLKEIDLIFNFICKYDKKQHLFQKKYFSFYLCVYN